MTELSSEARNAIKEIAEKRKIGRLSHFTRVENLQTIFQKGLVPREDDSVNPTPNSPPHDNKDCVCLSISHVSNMFYRIRKNSNTYDDNDVWCVLVFKPDILWQETCKFTPINGISRIIKERGESEFYGASALEAMFADTVITHEEKKENRPAHYPDNIVTNPQAEIRVHGSVPNEYLTEICFHPEFDEKHFSALERPERVEIRKAEWFFHTLDYMKEKRKEDFEDFLKWLNAPFS